MKIGVLGTGPVGEALATALVSNGHSVMMGSRTPDNEKGAVWVQKTGERALQGNFDDAAAFAEMIFICLPGIYTLNAVRSIHENHTKGKIFIDLTNPLDFSHGTPPGILEEFRDISLGERIQEELLHAHVVKTLNTINYKLMVNARVVNNGDHHLFLSGNSKESKTKVINFLVENFHWKPDHFVDLGSIQSARCVEAIVPFWVSVWQSLQTPLFNFRIVH
jgi:hypothetical protein